MSLNHSFQLFPEVRQTLLNSHLRDFTFEMKGEGGNTIPENRRVSDAVNESNIPGFKGRMHI